jgi:AMMECR1 domain-containing protein
MYSLVRKTLEVYLREKRIITQSDFPTDILSHLQSRESVFVTLYLDNRVGASSGRIDCKKENSVFECIDNTLLCLKDPRFSSVMQDATILDRIHIRVDRFMFRRKDGGTPYLRVLQKIGDLDIAHEGIIFLSQNL